MIEKLEELKFDVDRYENICSLCVTRWYSYASPLHIAAYMMDLELQGCGHESVGKASDGWRHILEHLVQDAGTRCKFRDQLENYSSFCGALGCANAQQDKPMIGVANGWSFMA